MLSVVASAELRHAKKRRLSHQIRKSATKAISYVRTANSISLRYEVIKSFKVWKLPLNLYNLVKERLRNSNIYRNSEKILHVNQLFPQKITYIKVFYIAEFFFTFQ